MFLGFVELGDVLHLMDLLKTSSGVPTNTDSLPTYRVYGPDGLLDGMTGSLALADVPGLYSADILCSSGNGFESSTTYFILVSGAILGVGAANLHTVTIT